MKKIVGLALAATMLFGFAGCGGNNSASGKEHTITVYRYMTMGTGEGSEDAAVERAIANKFYEDTGIKIRLDVKMYSHSELKTKVDTNWSKRTADMDGVVHYVSEDHGCATLCYASVSDTVKDLEQMVAENGTNITKYMWMDDVDAVRKMSCYVKNGDEFKMNYLVAAHNEGRYGLLVRKDYMREVQSVTGLDPEDYDVSNENYKNMSIDEFEKLLYALRKHYSNTEMKFPITGAPWDMDYPLANAFGVSGYSIQKGEDGRYGRPQFAPNTGEWLDTIQKWAHDGVWEAESLNVADSQRRGWFVSGQAAVYAADPTATNLITTKRMLEKVDSNAEVMLIAPLADKNGVVNGYTNVYAPDGLIIPEKSDDAEVLIKYIDWLYSDVENYELAAYGIKGEHWVEGEDRVVDGKTYKTWVYPDGKEDAYNENTPYQGRYNILENVYISNRVCGNYNTEEFLWTHYINGGFPIFYSNEIAGIHIGSAPREFKTDYNRLDGKYVEDIRTLAWAGLYKKNDQGVEEPASVTLANYIEWSKTYCKGYLDWLNDLIADAYQFRKDKFGV